VSEAIVSIVDVVKEYELGKTVVPALRGVSLDVHRGEFISIAGPSGSGKTTLLNLIGCVDVATRGTVRVVGRDTAALSERELTRLRLDTIGFIFQSFNLVGVLSVFQNVEFPLLLQGKLRGHDRRARVMTLLEQVGLADEPTANLDSETGERIIDLMKEMNQRDGTTFIFSTHDAKVMAHADAIVKLADGQIVGRESSVAALAASGGH